LDGRVGCWVSPCKSQTPPPPHLNPPPPIPTPPPPHHLLNRPKESILKGSHVYVETQLDCGVHIVQYIIPSHIYKFTVTLITLFPLPMSVS
jgi:hypothetical protein